MSKYCGRCYSDTISHDISSLADEISCKDKPRNASGAKITADMLRNDEEIDSIEGQLVKTPAEKIEGNAPDDKSLANLTDSQGTDASSIITVDAIFEMKESLNKNNAANDDQAMHQAHPSSKELVKRQSSKRIPFMYDKLPSDADLQPKYSEDLTVKRDYNPAHRGRRFIRSSSIMVKSGGREVSALDISKRKGHILRKQKDLNAASRKSNLNVFSNLNPSVVNQSTSSRHKKPHGMLNNITFQDRQVLIR